MSHCKSSFRHGILLACVLMPMVTYASTWPQVRLIEASTVRTPILGPVGSVCSAYDPSVCADVSQFFRPEKTQVARIAFVTALSPHLGLRVQVTEAAHAPKVSIQAKVQLGVLLSTQRRSGKALVYEVFSSAGGNLVHRPCVDSYGREYHCATLSAWSEYPNKFIRLPEYGARVNLRF
jgi:hypothetical protein